MKRSKSQAPIQHIVTVDEMTCTVNIIQTGKTTWKAYGDGPTGRLEVTGSSERVARSDWKDKALRMRI